MLWRACLDHEQPTNMTPFPVPTLDPDAAIPFALTDKALVSLQAPHSDPVA